MKIKKIDTIEEAYYDKYIDLYHGTPYKKAMEDIVKNGLDANRAISSSGESDSMPSIKDKNYLAKDLWDSARYAVLMAGNEEYGYVMKFRVKESELTADEDPLGSEIWNYLHNGKKPSFDIQLINYLPDELVKEIENDDKGYYDRNSKAGRDLFNFLTKEEHNKIVRNSRTATIDKNIKPVKVYKIKRPDKKLLDEWNNLHSRNEKTFMDSFKEYVRSNTKIYQIK